MKSVIRILILLIFVLRSQAPSAVAEPVILGLEGNHHLDAASEGRILMDELRCVACHEIEGQPTLESLRPAPVLERSAALIRGAYLKSFILDPHDANSQSLMPNVLGALDFEHGDHVATAITHYLKQNAIPVDVEYADAFKPATGGKQIYETIGCVACHGPSPTSESPDPSFWSLAHVTDKYTEATLSAFLYQPLKFHPSGSMPEMGLTQDEAVALATYLFEGANSEGISRWETDDALASEGQMFFIEFNCVACHKSPNQSPTRARNELKSHVSPTGCLARDPEGVPDFQLNDRQRKQLIEALKSGPNGGADTAPEAIELTRFNCIACHQRDNYGGPPEEIMTYFQTSEPELGDAARVPPPLTHVGARLKPAFLQKILFDGETYRPYMKTRMPQFGAANLDQTFEILSNADSIEPAPEMSIDRENQRAYRDAGAQLLGDKGLNCISCHTFNQLPSPGFQGIDLVASYERLNPDFFFHYLQDPANFRPGVVMPSFWPGGEAIRKDILDGDTEKQLHAISYYLSLGTSASPPSGMRNEGSRILVNSKPILYRGRSSIAGYRGIAVGFPNGLNYAFDAQNGALAAIWEGNFISVRWSGQGSGSFNPLGRPAELPRDLAFLGVQSQDTPWPLRPQTTKDNPINPDPTYPKNHGYQFRGYSLNEVRGPNLYYSIDGVAIDDCIESLGDSGQLRRSIQFQAPTALTMAFRIGAGDIRLVTPTTAQTKNLRIQFEPSQSVVRPLADANGVEIILFLDLPRGPSTFALTYEWLQ